VKVRAVTLDFGGTLDGSHHWRERFWRLYEGEGLACAPEAFARAFGAATRAAYGEAALREADLPTLVRYHVKQQHKELALPFSLASERIVEHFVADTRRALRAHAPVLERWRAFVRLGVISNFYGNLPVVLAREGIASLFDVVLDSNLVGRRKPERAIFALAMESLGVRPAEAIHVGDSLEHDVIGAREAGLHAAWLRPSPRGEECTLPANVICLGALEELEEHVSWTQQ
jgi:putative hydrolase of the HAD superfamily